MLTNIALVQNLVLCEVVYDTVEAHSCVDNSEIH